ncbi:hypothetical protein QBC33DRAFT_519814 [Phialemonium atrogriseum]|uniref:Uncharacterized protein n=1 Tax=Phialemonium atrogriseum TaxID=1093897 RepID=A0AAJ0BQ37_9PEZI|nr:uncharacterized protein QBC33DRAFT_519814 [Phialemonium atrogriseum]KAK1762145.1 hypothetical protein QBC33DRAFT_519814 [Phialemonium atrogriseum]
MEPDVAMADADDDRSQLQFRGRWLGMLASDPSCRPSWTQGDVLAFRVFLAANGHSRSTVKTLLIRDGPLRELSSRLAPPIDVGSLAGEEWLAVKKKLVSALEYRLGELVDKGVVRKRWDPDLKNEVVVWPDAVVQRFTAVAEPRVAEQRGAWEVRGDDNVDADGDLVLQNAPPNEREGLEPGLPLGSAPRPDQQLGTPPRQRERDRQVDHQQNQQQQPQHHQQQEPQRLSFLDNPTPPQSHPRQLPPGPRFQPKLISQTQSKAGPTDKSQPQRQSRHQATPMRETTPHQSFVSPRTLALRSRLAAKVQALDDNAEAEKRRKQIQADEQEAAELEVQLRAIDVEEARAKREAEHQLQLRKTQENRRRLEREDEEREEREMETQEKEHRERSRREKEQAQQEKNKTANLPRGISESARAVSPVTEDGTWTAEVEVAEKLIQTPMTPYKPPRSPSEDGHGRDDGDKGGGVIPAGRSSGIGGSRVAELKNTRDEDNPDPGHRRQDDEDDNSSDSSATAAQRGTKAGLNPVPLHRPNIPGLASSRHAVHPVNLLDQQQQEPSPRPVVTKPSALHQLTVDDVDNTLLTGDNLGSPFDPRPGLGVLEEVQQQHFPGNRPGPAPLHHRGTGIGVGASTTGGMSSITEEEPGPRFRLPQPPPQQQQTPFRPRMANTPASPRQETNPRDRNTVPVFKTHLHSLATLTSALAEAKMAEISASFDLCLAAFDGRRARAAAERRRGRAAGGDGNSNSNSNNGRNNPARDRKTTTPQHPTPRTSRQAVKSSITNLNQALAKKQQLWRDVGEEASAVRVALLGGDGNADDRDGRVRHLMVLLGLGSGGDGIGGARLGLL